MIFVSTRSVTSCLTSFGYEPSHTQALRLWVDRDPSKSAASHSAEPVFLLETPVAQTVSAVHLFSESLCDPRRRIRKVTLPCQKSNVQCNIVYLGDGLIFGNEACDDGNIRKGDGCSWECTIECGFNCDAAEPSSCASSCGDSLLAADEGCDDGNQNDGDGCSSSCALELGWKFSGACVGGAVMPLCGDGLLRGSEVCDDSNVQNRDGCSSSCTVDCGFSCSGLPSQCSTTCGDSIVAGVEECDDGGTQNGDGCSADCSTEDGFRCAAVGSCSASSCFSRCGDGIVVGNEECDGGERLACWCSSCSVATQK